MDCPKCGHQQTDTVKCASCGVYFAKFAQQQELIANRSGAAHDELPDSGFGWSALALTAILSTGTRLVRPARARHLSRDARATGQRGERRRADRGRAARAVRAVSAVSAVSGRALPARAAGS